LLVEKLVAAGADLNAQDVQGYTPLHYACEKGRVELVEKLVKLNADVNAQDNNGWTPVMTVVHNLSGKNEQEKIVKSLLSSKVRCDLDMQANVTKNTALHLACTVGNSTGVQLLLSNGAGVDYLNSARHTPLHTACSQYRGSDASCIREIIFLLRSHNCDVTIKDMYGKTALHCSVNCQDPNIPLSLITAGCDITAKDNQGQRFSDLAPLSLMQKVKKELLSFERRQIVCVIGHPKCGKSTLIAALEGNQAEYGQVYRFFFKPFTNINLTNIRTAGIEAKVIDGQSLQHVIFFDFAGQAEYYSSHLAFLESALSVKSGTTVTFIMMTDGRCTEKERFDQCMEWLFPIKTILKEHNQLDVLLVCSHFDQLWFWQQWNVIASLESISDKLNELLNCKNVNFKDHWGMDCRKMASAGISKLEKHLQNQRKQRLSDDSTSKVPLAACVLFDKLQKKSLNLAISVDDIALKLKSDKPPFPLTREYIDGLCRELASSGLALYICDQLNIGKNLLILEIGEVLTRIHGKLFAPNSQDFPMHHKNLANKFGLVNASELERAFKDSPLKPDVIGRFLIAMEFCHSVDADLLHSEIGQLLGTTEPGLQAANSRNWLCFPSLVSTEPPKQKLFDEEHIELCPWMCWELRTVNPHYFTPRFQHALFVRLGAKYVHHDTDDSQSEIIKHSCQVWKNGMLWSHRSGVHICIEIKQKCIVQILASGKPNLQPPKMNPVINLVSGVAQEVHIVKDHHSPGVATTSYLRKVVRGSPSDCYVLVTNFINAIKDNQEYVNNKEDGRLINIGNFLDDWNPCLSILDNMVLVKRSEVEAVTLSPCSSSEPEHTHSLDLPTPSDTTMVQRVSQSLPIATVHTELPSSHMRGFHKTADNSFNLLPSTHQSVSISRSQLVCNTDILEPTSYSLPKLSEVDFTEESLNFHIGKCIGDSWEKFATHLHIHRKVIEGVHKECSGIVRDCFVAMTRKWLHSEIGTGDLPRTWQTVCDALEKIDHPDIAEDVKETLLVETGEVKVQMLLNKYRDRFYSDVDSHAIYRRLEVEGVIPNSLAFKIKRTPVKESNDMLFLHLRDHGDMETLRRFCDVLITVGEDGYPRMLQMGQSFQDSISQHIQVAPFESI
jgi:ankyrin repeat protein